MKALVLKGYGAKQTLEFTELACPAIKSNEVLVQVHAAGLNPIDNMIPKGMFKPILKFQLPAVMGSDLAGVVVQVGAAVRRFKVGDAVFASVFDMDRGSFAEYVAVPESAVAHKPSNISFVEAAALPMVALTAWQALHERLQLKRGQKIFIPAGAGGIGTIAIQLAKQIGAFVATTTSTGNVELVRELGADEVVDYKKQAFENVLQGYDAVLGTMREAELEKTFRILAPGSNVVSLVGPPDANFARARGMNVIMPFLFSLISGKIRRLAKSRNANYSFMFVRPDGQQLSAVAALLESGKIRSVVDKVFGFEDALEGLAYLEQGRAKGKVVLQMIAD
ncbi:NADP-dependent oxidoreductase [Undibacterium cyanobacteriorum]|uniref:NADP-dependent oxidoreductase n=1 Tax=Undibacterium cyanobacteriorum TaxID=3073561 RepID=A0ABY9RKV5_9BURK|nr:NADP-dependent oxidoreductase [Undibacterium sp. 20NA77.5]WMW81839.1 NADP-dependent oxidoreductase [Undibacterium sp. 20NA77.5]